MKCRIVQMILSNGSKPPSEVKIAQELGLQRSTVRNLLKRFDYESTRELVSELFNEVGQEN